MLIQLNDGQVLAVDFKYSVEGDRKPNGRKNRNAGRRSTECRVRLKVFVDRWYDSRNKVHNTKISFFAPVAEGKSTCCLEDVFNKQVGRAIAFSRAIENSFHPYIKDNLEEIIQKYCEMDGISEIKELPKPQVTAPTVPTTAIPKATCEKCERRGDKIVGTVVIPGLLKSGLIEVANEPPATNIAPTRLGDLKLKISVVE